MKVFRAVPIIFALLLPIILLSARAEGSGGVVVNIDSLTSGSVDVTQYLRWEVGASSTSFANMKGCVIKCGPEAGYCLPDDLVAGNSENVEYFGGNGFLAPRGYAVKGWCKGYCLDNPNLCSGGIAECEPMDSHYIALSHHGYQGVWYGGFSVSRTGGSRTVRWCVVDGFTVRCYHLSTSPDDGAATVDISGWPQDAPRTWPVGHSPGEWTGDGAAVDADSVMIVYNGDYARILLGGESYSTSTCSYSRHGLFYLTDGGVPVSAKITFKEGNPTFDIDATRIHNAARSGNFSCAGPVVSANGTGILPPACGVKTSEYITFGSFVPSGSLKKFSFFRVMDALGAYQKNNRTFSFRLGDTTVRGSDAVMLVSGPVSSPMTVTIPALSTSSGATMVANSVAVATSLGNYKIVPNVLEVGKETHVVIPPEIVNSVAISGGVITVRAIAVADIGQMSSPYSVIWGDISRKSEGQITYTLFFQDAFAAAMPVQSAVSNGWFLPYHDTISAGVARVCGHQTTIKEVGYYRYVADVAQASVRFIPVQASTTVPAEALKVAVHPDAPQKSAVFYGDGTVIPIPADVPLKGAVRLDLSGTQITVTYTHPISGQVVISVPASSVRISGGLLMPPCGLGWRTQNCEIDASWEDVSPTVITTRDMTWNSAANCVRYNMNACYSPLVSPDGAATSISGWLKIRATATVTLSLSAGPQSVVVTAESPVRQYNWPLFILQETR